MGNFYCDNPDAEAQKDVKGIQGSDRIAWTASEGYPCIYQDDYKAAAKLTEQMAESGNISDISRLQTRMKQSDREEERA